jgi:Septum formation
VLLQVGVLRVLACLTLVFAGSACSGSDGPKGSAQAAAPSPTLATPAAKVGNCYLTVISVSYPSTDLPMDCAKSHRAETFSVGTFAGEHASRTTLPPAGSPALRWAFNACDTEARRFVGGDWRGGLLSIQVVVPSPQDWEGGSRWYRCDIFELDSLDGGTYRNHQKDHATERTGTLRDALTRRLPLVFTCFNEDEWKNLEPVACDKRHRFEFAGIWRAPELVYDTLDDNENQLYRSCWSVIGAFVGASRKVDMGDYVGVTFRTPSPEAWQRGDRGIRCFLWSEDRDLTRSVKGAGLGALS